MFFLADPPASLWFILAACSTAMLLAHVMQAQHFPAAPFAMVLLCILSHFVSLGCHLCIVHQLHIVALSVPSLIPLSSPYPPSIFSFSSPFFAIVSSVRRGLVLLTALSPQARIGLLRLQPVPETRVESLRSAQPPPALLLLQHWAVSGPLSPQHPTKHPFIFSPLPSKPVTNPLHRPWPSRHTRGGCISSRGRWASKFCGGGRSVSTAHPANILGIPEPWAAALRRQISV